MKQLSQSEQDNWKKYLAQGKGSFFKPELNKLNITTNNGKEHEMAKASLFYDLRKMNHQIITEAEDKKTGLRRDIVDLTSGEIIEIEKHSCERGHRHSGAINVFFYDIQEWKDGVNPL